MKPIYLTHYQRSAFTRAHPKKTVLDDFAELSGVTLMSRLIDHCLQETAVSAESVDDLTLGCALGVQEQWSFGGRYPVLQSKLGDQCASRLLDQQCGSGLAALRYASLLIASGAADIALAGGYENMTRVPMGPHLFEQGVLTVPPMQAHYDVDKVMNMGLTAEDLAIKGQISRYEMDEYACRSHQHAALAQQQAFFDAEIVALEKADGEQVQRDACIRPETDMATLAALRPAFKQQGCVTAGNSSPLTSGAALAMLMSESALLQTGMQPLARVIACVDRGTQPELMGQGVVTAIQKLLHHTGVDAQQIDFWEINEAFSVVPLYAIKQLQLDPERVNIHGGAIALGHPLGASGIRLAGSLSRILQQQQGRLGVAAACIGGGQGLAMLIERC